jgi:sugar transferase EpsL
MGKRLIDSMVAGVALILLFPLMVATAVVVLICMGRPILFRQQRPGLDGRLFNIFKFRTMSQEHGIDAARLTGLGRLLRRASLDELPELWNVLRGDMSLVGPRPLLPEYLPLYDDCQARRHEVRPGITGWAQVNGRNALDWPERFKLDVWYVDNRSFWMDMRILAMTLVQLFKTSEVNSKGHATMKPFKGNK